MDAKEIEAALMTDLGFVSVSVPANAAVLRITAEYFRNLAQDYEQTPDKKEPSAQDVLGVDTEDINGPGGPGVGEHTAIQSAKALGALIPTGCSPGSDVLDISGIEFGDSTIGGVRIPWDKRIHSGGQSKKLKGTDAWKLKKGVDSTVVAEITEELRLKYGEVNDDNGGAGGLPPGPSGADNTGGPGGPQGPSGPGEAEEITFPKLMMDFTKNISAGTITQEQGLEVAQSFGMAALPDLINPDKPFTTFTTQVYKKLAAIWNSTQ